MKTVLILLSFVCILSGCGTPPPDDVVRAFLDEVNSKNYEDALVFAGPKLVDAYSNHLWLAESHQMYVSEEDSIVELPENVTATSAQVRVSITFHEKGTRQVFPCYLMVDMLLNGKWYIDDVWYLDKNGRYTVNALDTLPKSPFQF